MVQPVVNLYRSAFSGLSKQTWWLSITLLVNRSGTMVIPFLTLYLTNYHHYSIAQAGIVMGLFGAGAIAGGFLGGKLTDKFGFYPVQVATLSGGGLFFILLGQMPSYSLICICTFLLALVNESFRPANATAIAHYSAPENRTRSYSLNRLAINLGWAVGGATGGLLASINYHLLFWVDGATNLLAAALLWKLMSKPESRQVSHKEIHHETNNSAYRDKFYLLFIVFVTFYAICFFQLFTNLPVFFKQQLQFSEQFIGLLMAINGLIITFFEMILIYQLEGKRSNLSYISFGVTLVSLSFLLYNLFPGGKGLAICAMIIVTMGEILSMPFMNSFWISRSSSTNRGQYAGLYTIAWATAQVLGPVVGSQVAQQLGFTSLWWMISSLCFFGACGFFSMRLITARASNAVASTF
jgi:predicted MFS family arabinose efflux permease